ncbi:type II secretion system F family protein [Morganella morganii]|uniref:type II secretion system F family protein n=1 Tax=Morganella morganii TaxID=582 RepID=UPI0032DB5B20
MQIYRLYDWSGLTSADKVVTGTLISSSENNAVSQLISQSITPVSLFCRKRLVCSQKEKQYLLHFTRQLTTLLTSGLPLLKALILLAGECSHPLWEEIVRALIRQLQQGKTFTQGIMQYPGLFDSFYCQMATVGEETGKLPECLHTIAQHIQSNRDHRAALFKSIRYPAALLIISFLMITLMFLFVIPEFAKIYTSFGAELPALTQWLIRVSGVITGYTIPAMGITAAIIFIYHVFRQRNPDIKKTESTCILRIPFIGNIIIFSCVSHIFRILAMTQQSGITLISGIDTLIMTTTHPLYKEALIVIREDLLHGKTFSKSIKQSGLFPFLCHELIATGEATGQFGHFFLYTADWFKSLALNQIQTFFKILQPVLFILLAILVAILLIAMYLPLFRLGEVLV